MIRLALGALAAAAALPALAQEGGPIRSGEHDGFTRVVMIIEPTTEWSLETAPGEAVIFFPGRRLDFGTGEAFDRIGRTRVTAIQPAIEARGTRVRVGVGCDCRITASFVGARHLALDVGDRGVARPAVAPTPEPAGEDAAARAEREALAGQGRLLLVVHIPSLQGAAFEHELGNHHGLAAPDVLVGHVVLVSLKGPVHDDLVGLSALEPRKQFGAVLGVQQ